MTTKNKPTIASHEMKVMKLAQLKPHPKNARDIDPEALDALRQSMRKFGVVEHLVHNERTGFLVGGHQRLRILLEDGITEEKVVIVDLDEVEEEALRLVLNNPKAQGHFTDQVGSVLDSIEAEREDLFRSLRLDSLRPPEKAPIGIFEVPTSTVTDTFLMTISGPLPKQPDVLELLRKALLDMPDVDVQIVTQRQE